jgi:hypothetical protein
LLSLGRRTKVTANLTARGGAPPVALRGLLRGLAGHHIFDEPNNGGEDSAGDAATNRLPKHRADIDVPRRPLEHRQQRREKRSAARAAERAGNGITERAEVDVLHCGTRGITAYRTGYELNKQIDERG